MKYVLSLDGGGTKVDCLIANEYGELTGSGKGGPTNSNYMSRKDIQASISSSIKQALNEAKISSDKIGIVYTAVSVDKETMNKIIKDVLHKDITVNICPESQVSLFAAILKDYGGITQAGTGSFAAIRANDKNTSVGGWGTILGEEGSGYHIGKLALVASLKMLEGRGQYTILKEEIFKHLKIKTAGNLFQFIYCLSQGERRKLIASLCPIVAQAAFSGDVVSKHIMIETGRALSELTISALKLSKEKADLEISFAGGVWKSHPIIYNEFLNDVHARYPKIKITKPIFEPVVGGILLGLRDMGYPIDKQIDTLKRNFFGQRFPQAALEDYASLE